MNKVIILILFHSYLSLINTKDDIGFRYISKIYEECEHSEGFVPCLKKKAILFFDRAARMQAIPLIEGVEIIKTSPSELPAISENEIDTVLPRNLDKDEALTRMLWDRVASFANSRTVQLSLPKISGEELNKGVVEGRGKMKKMMGMMMMGAAMKMVAMVPVAMAGLFMMAGKALIVSKIALLLAGIMLLKKLMSSKGSGGGGGGHESQGWSSGGSSGGWDRRAIDLAYSSYKKD